MAETGFADFQTAFPDTRGFQGRQSGLLKRPSENTSAPKRKTVFSETPSPGERKPPRTRP
ncbi:hypothetical protein HMPREF9123_2557 [Neisseria bacilliformis ATCC BAA-1200]|uniref:Uncharacterized protein n=1 Tax=Neisseria bacilliformis ATCC BAA-1200 TaxID=888742 RepID=F2BFQ0_9NEIS|nr:hypothetical protein HMPREF9123_2557 [Neisseria bacilliformis ATCC BAA-1200]